MIVNFRRVSISFQYNKLRYLFSIQCVSCYCRYFDEINDDLEQDLDSDIGATWRPTPSKPDDSMQQTPISDIIIKNDVPVNFVTHL
jgi:hypothetical protein